MKKIVFVVLFLMAANVSFSQIMKGQWMVGGDAAFTSTKTKEKVTSGGQSVTTESESVSRFSLNPNAGYFLMDKLAGGLRVNLETAKGGYSNYLIAPFVRYYFLPTAQQVNVFVDGSFGFGGYKANSNDENHSSTGFQIMAGPAIFLNPKVALEIAPFFRSTSSSETVSNVKYKNTENVFGAQVGFQIHLGKGATSSKK